MHEKTDKKKKKEVDMNYRIMYNLKQYIPYIGRKSKLRKKLKKLLKKC